MTNEQRVEAIRNGGSVTENMKCLYLENLPLIKKFIKPYTSYETEEDLLQEAYFGLCEAVRHYETSENVLFTNPVSTCHKELYYTFQRSAHIQ